MTSTRILASTPLCNSGMCWRVGRQPVLWIFAAVCLGAAIGQWGIPSPSAIAVAWAAALIALLVAVRRQRGVAVVSLSVVLLVAMWRGREVVEPPVATRVCNAQDGDYRAVVDDSIERIRTAERFEQRTVVRITAERCGSAWVSREGRWGVRLVDGPEVARGDLVQVRLRLRPAAASLNPVGVDPLLLARQRDVVGWARGRAPHVVLHRSYDPLARLDRARHAVARALERHLGHGQVALAKALVLGDQGEITPARRRAWADAGMAHLLSISGLHVGMIAALIYWLLRVACAALPGAGERFSTRRLAALLALVPLAVFCLGVGASPPAVRSTIMSGAVLAGLALGRPSVVANALGLAGAAIVLVSPMSLADPGFLLSFAAVGMLLALPRLPRFRLPGMRPLVALVIVSTAATLATAPLALHFFGRVSLVAPIVNLPAVPIATIVATPLLVGYAPLAVASTVVGDALAPVVGRVLAGLDDLATFSSAWRYAAVSLAPLGAVSLAAYVVLLVAGLASWRMRRARWVALCALVVLSGSVAWTSTAHWRSDELVVVHPYVGQGDATLLLLPGGTSVLVDAGGSLDGEGWDPGEQVLVPLLARYGVRRLDLAVVTHPHPDHLNGFARLAEEVSVDELWYNGDDTTHPVFEKLARAVRDGGGVVRGVQELAPRVRLGGVDIEILYPVGPLPVHGSGRAMSDGNNRSVVLRVTYGARSILLAGDIEQPVEELLAPRLAVTDVLKAPHHGSSTSSSSALLDAIRPRLVVISCGVENQFRFPASTVLRRYADVGAHVLRTDLDGLVELRTSGDAWQIRTHRGGAQAELGAYASMR